jgi:hypothetical protein
MSYEDIPGYSGFEWLYKEWVQAAPRNAVAVEVGVALGHSIACLAAECIKHGRNDIEIWAVDPWGGYARNGEQQEKLGGEPGPGDFRLFIDSMLAHAPDALDRIRVIRADSTRAARLFRACDLVLIDAAHDFQSVVDDIESWQGKMRMGSILAGDDHEPNYPDVEQACKALFGAEYETKGSTWIKRY